MNLYVGAARWTGGTLGGVFRQTADDGGWDRLVRGLPDAIQVQAIAVHPQQPEVVYLGADDGLYRSAMLFRGHNQDLDPQVAQEVRQWQTSGLGDPWGGKGGAAKEADW